MRDPSALDLDLRWSAQHSGGRLDLDLAPTSGEVIEFALDAMPQPVCEIVAQGESSYTLDAVPQPVCEVSIAIFADCALDAVPQPTCSISFAIGSALSLDAKPAPSCRISLDTGLTFSVNACSSPVASIRARYNQPVSKPDDTVTDGRHGPVNLNLRSDGRWFDSGRLDLNLGGAPRPIPRANRVVISVTAC